MFKGLIQIRPQLRVFTVFAIMLGSPSVTLDLTRGINSSATTCLRAVNKPHNDTHGVHLPYSWPRQKVRRLGRSWNVLTFCCFDYLQWELRRALKMEKQVTALCPRQGKHTEKSRTNPWVPIFFFSFNFLKKIIIITGIRRGRARTCCWSCGQLSDTFLNLF